MAAEAVRGTHHKGTKDTKVRSRRGRFNHQGTKTPRRKEIKSNALQFVRINNMPQEYYGPTMKAVQVINGLLKLPATGREQDWEIELSDPNKIGQMLGAYSMELDLDYRSALALILLSSMQDAKEAGVLEDEHFQRALSILEDDSEVRQRMRFYWMDQKMADDTDLLDKLTRQR